MAMRRVFLLSAVFVAAMLTTAQPVFADEPVASAQIAEAETAEYPPGLTPDTMRLKADLIDRFALDKFASPGGHFTKALRMEATRDLQDLADQLRDQADVLEKAIVAESKTFKTLQQARLDALQTSEAAAIRLGETGNGELSSSVYELLVLPEGAPPEPVYHRFCLQAGGIGPRTYDANVPDVIDNLLVTVTGHIASSVRRVADDMTYFALTVEPDANFSPMAVITAMRDVADDAAAKMDPPRLASTTILMGDLADEMCGVDPLEF